MIGFDDTPIAAHIWPPLTTVRWPIVSMARSAARKLVGDMVGGQAAGEQPSSCPRPWSSAPRSRRRRA